MAITVQVSDGISSKDVARKALLFCGILSSLLYVVMNIFVPMRFEGYSKVTQTVSELSAIDAPTRPLWIPLAMVYVVLMLAFGWGVRKSAGENRHLRIMGGLMIAYSLANFYWPPMHLRGTPPSPTDAPHLAWSMVAVVFTIVMMVYGALALGKASASIPSRRWSCISCLDF